MLNNEIRQLELSLSQVISAAVSQRRTLTLSFSKQSLQVFKESELIFQHKVPKGFLIKNQNTPALDSWLEDVYPSGVQSPFTIQLLHSEDLCLLTTSLRGRVSIKCFFN